MIYFQNFSPRLLKGTILLRNAHRKAYECTTGSKLTGMPSISCPVTLPPQQYASSPFNSMPVFLKPPRKMPTEKHTNVQLPMSILLHGSNSIMQQAHRQGKHKKKDECYREQWWCIYYHQKYMLSSQSQSMIAHEGSTTATRPRTIVIGNAHVPLTSS